MLRIELVAGYGFGRLTMLLVLGTSSLSTNTPRRFRVFAKFGLAGTVQPITTQTPDQQLFRNADSGQAVSLRMFQM